MTHLAGSIRRVSNTDGGIVMDLRRGTLFRVNPLGSRILDLLDKGASPGEIAEQLSAEFRVALDVLRDDVTEFLDRLNALGILNSCEPER